MTKQESRNVSPKESHSINVSVYRPSGLAAFFSWFSRKNRSNLTDLLQKADNFDLKLKMDDLKALKMNGIDLEKLQNYKHGKNKGTCKNKIFVIPNSPSESNDNEYLNGLGIPNNLKKENLIKTKKIYEKKVKSTSTISIKSKTNFGNRNKNYTRNIISQRSTVNSVTSFHCKSRMKDSNIKPTESNPLNRSVLLKSVPTAILKSNTQKKVFVPLYVGKRKTENVNKVQNNKLPVSMDTKDHCDDNTNVIPMLLTKIKSMEEQLSGIENTTKKINEAVSQNNITRTNSLPKNLNPIHKNGQPMTKVMPSHKIYSKNIHTSRKPKVVTQKKLKNKSKLTVPTTFYDYTKFHDMRFQTVNSDGNSQSNNFKESNSNGKEELTSKNPMKAHIFSIGDDRNKDGFEKSQNPDYNIIYNLLKGLSVENYSEGAQPNSNSMKEDKFTSGNVIIDANCFMSKPTFDWKHKSLSSASETPIEKENDLIVNEKNPHSLIDSKNIDSKLNNLNLASNRKVVLTNKDNPEHDTLKKELNKEQTEISDSTKERKENEIKKTKLLEKETKPKAYETKIYEEKNKEEYTRKLYQDIIQKLEDQRDFSTDKKSANEEIQGISYDCKSNYKKNISKTIPTLNHSGDGQNCIAEKFKEIPQIKHDQYNNEKSKVKKVGGKKMITRATQSDRDPNEGVKVCVETSSGDKVKIENSSCGSGLTVVASGGVSLFQSNPPSHKDNVKKCDKEEQNKRTAVFPKNVNIIKETVKKEDMCLISQQLSSINTGYLNNLNKEGLFYKGIDKFVPPKQIESDIFAFRCPGEYMSQEKRKTYDEFLKKGSRLNQHSIEAIHRPFSIEKINETTLFEDPFRKSIKPSSVSNSYLTRQEAKHSRSSISVVDTQFCPKIMQCSPSCTENNTQLFEQKELGCGGEKTSKLENSVRNIKMLNCSDINLFNDLPTNKQPFLTVLEEKDELDSKTLVRQLTTLELKRRSCRNGFTIQEAIAEETNKDLVLVNSASEHQSEKGDNIKIKSLDESLRHELHKMEYSDLSESENKCKVFTAQLHNVEASFKYFNELTLLKSSVSVQTDWSLIGITVDHFKNDQPLKKCRTSVSIQTEITMDQLSTSGTVNDILPMVSGPCVIKSNVNEEENIFSNCDVLYSTGEEEKQNCNDRKISTEIADIEINNQETMKDRLVCSNVQVEKQIEAACVKNIDFNLSEFKCNGCQIDFKSNNYAPDHYHECCIPCFTSLSEESLLSDKSEFTKAQTKPTDINSALSEKHKKSVISFNVNKELISINEWLNTNKITDAEKESSLKSSVFVQTTQNSETSLNLLSQNNIEARHILALPRDTLDYKSNFGVVSSSNTTIKIVTTNEEICSPSKSSGHYLYNIFKNNISTKISSE